MSHKLRSNQSVVFNSETQASGVLEINAEQVIYQDDGRDYHNVLLQMPVKVSGSGQYVSNLNYNVPSDTWSTFYSESKDLLSPDTGDYDETMETALHYARVQIDGKWGLAANDWVFVTESAEPIV